MLLTIENIKNRLYKLKIEVVMGKYYDGWTLRGMKVEIKRLEKIIKELNNK